MIENKPWALVPNKIVRYPGGREIDRFRGVVPCVDDGRPEAWVGSVTPVINAADSPNPHDGCAWVDLPDGRCLYLFEAIAENPEKILGAAHRAISGNGLGMLVKLLDAQHQLELQCHPSREYARIYFDSTYGKEESWYIIGLREDTQQPPYVYLGFKEGVTREQFAKAYDQGDIRAMEDCCHKIPVQIGDQYFLGAGVPHAVGPGCFLVEVQEPSDITVGVHQLRHRQPDCTPGQEAVHRARLLGAYCYDGASEAENLKRWKVQPSVLREGAWGREELLIGPDQTDYFSATRLEATGEAELRHTGFPMIAIVLSGGATLYYQGGQRDLRQGDELFVPVGVSSMRVIPNDAGITILLAHPPGAKHA